MQQTVRREQLVERATDYVLEHGLVELSLRPLAAAIGTSDRMLLYHLGSKDQLVVEVIRCSLERSLRQLVALPPSASPGAAVHDQWSLWTSPSQTKCERIYVEASTLGLFGREPYASSINAANQEWMSAMRGHLSASGVPPARLDQVALLVDAAFMGFELDLPLGADDVARGVAALAEAVDALCR